MFDTFTKTCTRNYTVAYTRSAISYLKLRCLIILIRHRNKQLQSLQRMIRVIVFKTTCELSELSFSSQKCPKVNICYWDMLASWLYTQTCWGRDPLFHVTQCYHWNTSYFLKARNTRIIKFVSCTLLDNSFVLSYEGKSVETLWLEFKEALSAGIGKFIPTKFVGQKKHLPWITQPIRREIRKRDRLYKKFKRSKAPKDRKTFLNSKHGVKTKIKMAYDKYLEDILGLNDDTGNQPFCRKKLFAFLRR